MHLDRTRPLAFRAAGILHALDVFLDEISRQSVGNVEKRTSLLALSVAKTARSALYAPEPKCLVAVATRAHVVADLVKSWAKRLYRLKI
jgi:hypothetical protein